MFLSFNKMRGGLFYRACSVYVLLTFISGMALPPAAAQSISGGFLGLPAPGMMVPPSPGYFPALIKGMTVHPENPLLFDFIVDSGDSGLAGTGLAAESNRLVKYFLSTITVPESDLWVNLSPYEKERIIPDQFGKTEMGRDLLAQDYILKQLTSSLMHPEDPLGGEFWKRVRAKAKQRFGTDEIPINTFNKVWILPEKAVVYEQDHSVFVVQSSLKVMLEEDYLAKSQGHKVTRSQAENGEKQTMEISTAIIRDLLIPEIEKEVNGGKNFALLRQIY